MARGSRRQAAFKKVRRGSGHPLYRGIGREGQTNSLAGTCNRDGKWRNPGRVALAGG